VTDRQEGIVRRQIPTKMATASYETKQIKGGAFKIALGAIVSSSAAPYGYTLSVWSSGAVLISARSIPSVGDVFLFAVGALCAFNVLALLTSRLGATRARGLGRERVITGALHWFAVGIALGAATLIAQIPSWVAWPLGSFAATTVYLLGATLQLAVVVRWFAEEGRGARGGL
jgi:heme/copper-type cytochrome/quinol oxidase subunit 3